MPKHLERYGIALVGVAVAVGVIAAVVTAVGPDNDDYIAPASTVVQASLKPGTKTTFVAQAGPATVTSHCTASSTSGTTPAHGLKMAIKPMSFTGCTDSLGARDGTHHYTTSGVWHVKFHDVADDEAMERPGDRLVITVPIKGMTVVGAADPRCTITVAPTAPAPIVAVYNDRNTMRITDAPLPIAYSSDCPGGAATSTAHFTATYILTPGIHDAS